MADIDIERRPKANILPWLIGLAILVVVVGWLLWRNNRIPEVEGRRETTPETVPVGAQQQRAEALAEALPVASEPMGEVGEAEVEREPEPA